MEIYKYESRNPNYIWTNKLHKQNHPTCPTVNWCNAPGYELSKFTVKILSQTMRLPFAFNIKNSITLMKEINNITFNDNIKMCSFDVENMIQTSQYKK
jgi:hypothetical protein